MEKIAGSCRNRSRRSTWRTMAVTAADGGQEAPGDCGRDALSPAFSEMTLSHKPSGSHTRICLKIAGLS